MPATIPHRNSPRPPPVAQSQARSRCSYIVGVEEYVDPQQAMAPLTDAQKRATEIVPRFTSALSVLGSTFILFSILLRRRRHNNHRNGTNRRAPLPSGDDAGASLLMGMSVADLLSSCSYVIGSAAFPEANGGQGNQATCHGACVCACV